MREEHFCTIFRSMELKHQHWQEMGILDTEMPTIKSEYMLQKIQEKIL